MIAEQLKQVEANIQTACKKAGRERSEVTLIAVSKTKPISMLQEALDCGIREFGENKAQEMKEKYELLQKDIHWHFIGHLQTNKIKYILGKTALIHSIDTLHLAKALETACEKKNIDCDILCEINVAQEDSKFGQGLDEAEKLIRDIAQLPHLHIQGLMTIAPNVDSPEKNRMIFRQLKQFSVDIKSKNIDNVNMNVLSMGMTGDYMIAIEEGATHVRVGTGIFGARDYTII